MKKDYSGQRFGKLIVVEPTEKRSSNGSVVWLCKCDCGNYTEVSAKEFRKGARTKSCGCLRSEQCKNRTTHHGTKERLYGVWMGMRRRCYDKKAKDFHRYGGRNISVCEDWQNYETFRSWALSNGYNPYAKSGECTLDRVDPNGNYCPENCRFVPILAQERNRRNNVMLTYNGKTQTLSQWEEEIGCNKGFIRDRIKRGWSVEDAITAPPKYNYKPHTAKL